MSTVIFEKKFTDPKKNLQIQFLASVKDTAHQIHQLIWFHLILLNSNLL